MFAALFSLIIRSGTEPDRVVFYSASRVPLKTSRDARRRAKTSLKARDKRPLCTRRLQLRTLVVKITPSHTITALDFSDEHIIRGPVTANDTLGNSTAVAAERVLPRPLGQGGRGRGERRKRRRVR